jgi:hypothetical protein
MWLFLDPLDLSPCPELRYLSLFDFEKLSTCMRRSRGPNTDPIFDRQVVFKFLMYVLPTE